MHDKTIDAVPHVLRAERATPGARTPRVVYVIGQLGPGGAERQLFLLLQTMDRDRYRPAVVVWNFASSDPYVSQIAALGVQIHTPRGHSSAQKLLSFRGWVQRVRPHVVHSYSFFTNVAAYVGALGTGAAVIGAVRGDFRHEGQSSGLVRWFVNARWPRVQVFNSAAAVENARRSWRLFQPRHAVVVRNGLDLDRFAAAPADSSGVEPPRVLGVGSLLPVKRWDRVVRAAAALKARGVDVRIDIAGDGPLRGSLEALARELAADDCVRFLGHVPRIEDELRHASMLVHTSDSEGTPNAVIEAMAAGLAVVATDSGDVPALVEHQRTGYVVKRGDDVALTEALSTLIADAELRRQMGRAARIKAEREFRLERLLLETLEVYKVAGWRDQVSPPANHVTTTRKGTDR